MMTPNSISRSSSHIKVITSQQNKFKPRSFKKNKAGRSFLNQTQTVNNTKVGLHTTMMDGEISTALNQTSIPTEINTMSVLKEQQYFEDLQRKEKSRKELLQRCRNSYTTMQTIVKIQAMCRGMIDRKKVYKKFQYRSFSAVAK